MAEVPLNTEVAGRKYEDSYAVDREGERRRQHLYCADVANFRVVVMDAEQRQVVGSVPVGRYPYALAVVGDRVYVANIGLFEYSPIRAAQRYDASTSAASRSRLTAIPARKRATEWSLRAGKFPAWASRTCRNPFPSGVWMFRIPQRRRSSAV